MTGLVHKWVNLNGIGTPQPFRFLTFEGKSSLELKQALDALNLECHFK